MADKCFGYQTEKFAKFYLEYSLIREFKKEYYEANFNFLQFNPLSDRVQHLQRGFSFKT
jgi:hypothetical protein